MKFFQKKKKTYRSLQIDWILELKRVAHVTFPTRHKDADTLEISEMISTFHFRKKIEVGQLPEKLR